MGSLTHGVVSIALLASAGWSFADERTPYVLSTSPDKKIEVYTLVDEAALKSAEEIAPHLKGKLLGAGIYARFVGADSPPSTLWRAGENCRSVSDVEWDPSSTRLWIRQGDEKAWSSKLFVLRRDVRTGRLLFVEPTFPELMPLFNAHAEVPPIDKRARWQSGITEWRHPERAVLSLFLLGEDGRLVQKEGWWCQVRLHFASAELHEFELLKIERIGRLPSEQERPEQPEGTAAEVRILYEKAEPGGAAD